MLFSSRMEVGSSRENLRGCDVVGGGVGFRNLSTPELGRVGTAY